MAETKSDSKSSSIGSDAADEAVRVRIMLEENELIPPTGFFVGDNGVGYMLRPGEEMDVPMGVLEILNNATMSVPVVDPQTLEVVSYRSKKMYPYSRV